jgi:pentose-5-phosphate-3-epimerase
MNTIKTLSIFVLLVLLMSLKPDTPTTNTITRVFNKVSEVQEYIRSDINQQGYRVVTVVPYISNIAGKDYTSFLVVAEK